MDYNRSGLPLAEIVSEPDVSSAREAVEYVTTLRRRVRYSGASDVDLEKGMMRFDANVSMKCSDERLVGVQLAQRLLDRNSNPLIAL